MRVQELYPSANGGINATFEIAMFSGWTVCEETQKKLRQPRRPQMSLQEFFDSLPDESENKACEKPAN